MKEEQAKLVVQVQPNASRNKVTGFKEGVLYIRIAEPPVKGKANQGLIKYLSGILGIDKSRIVIQKGVTSKRKLITISQLHQDQVMKDITSWLGKHKT